MRTTIVPAQITTVEDKIAANLTFVQIMLLFAALTVATLIYMLAPIPMKLTSYKIPLVLVLSGICLILSIRLKGKVIIEWFLIIATFALRPQFYIFEKNDITSREEIIDEKLKIEKTNAHNPVKTMRKTEKRLIADIVAVERVLLNPNKNVSFALSGKGGINVKVSEK